MKTLDTNAIDLQTQVQFHIFDWFLLCPRWAKYKGGDYNFNIGSKRAITTQVVVHQHPLGQVEILQYHWNPHSRPCCRFLIQIVPTFQHNSKHFSLRKFLTIKFRIANLRSLKVNLPSEKATSNSWLKLGVHNLCIASWLFGGWWSWSNQMVVFNNIICRFSSCWFKKGEKISMQI